MKNLILFCLVIYLVGIVSVCALDNSSSKIPEFKISFNRSINDYNVEAVNTNTTVFFTKKCLDKKCTFKLNNYEIKDNQTIITLNVKLLNNRMNNNIEIVDITYYDKDSNTTKYKPKAKIIVKNAVINREYNQFLRLKGESVNVNRNHFKNYTKIFIKKEGQKPMISQTNDLIKIVLYTNNGKLGYDVVEDN